ncbi:uncharacterized protein LOC110856231 [Folsomia candida]|uniref:Uncharacterized protein n=1 Tax=Folsomia candida TaxID=158441 RepID=A0A226DP61_FOLCA|nr:uncharacterized protein LOC110856231 [Folsomia candida]OXA46624.1 hypothetical protein Fcan01_18797 [Folsomia candida]
MGSLDYLNNLSWATTPSSGTPAKIDAVVGKRYNLRSYVQSSQSTVNADLVNFDVPPISNGRPSLLTKFDPLLAHAGKSPDESIPLEEIEAGESDEASPLAESGTNTKSTAYEKIRYFLTQNSPASRDLILEVVSQRGCKKPAIYTALRRAVEVKLILGDKDGHYLPVEVTKPLPSE